MELEGVLTRAHDVPQVRRKLPSPFSRPRVDLDGGRRVKRTWADVSVLDVRAGDTVANFGKVSERAEFINVTHGDLSLRDVVTSIDDKTIPIWRVRLYNVMGDYQDFPGEQRVFAFTAEAADG